MNIYTLKSVIISIIVSFFLNGCFIFASDDFETIKTNAKTISELSNGINISPYSKLKDTIGFPIVAWLGIPSSRTTIERFQEAKDAGININYSYYPNANSVEKALDIAEKVGMKILIRCPELQTNTAATVKKFMHHPSNAGYYIVDEPSLSSFSSLKNIINEIEKNDSQHLCYVNLYPNYATPDQLGTSDYNQYVTQSIKELNLKLLSFDYYPIQSGNYIRPIWYKNIESIRKASVFSNIPFWAFALTTSHSDYPIPTLQHLRLQVYSNLAYGAKGIQYYTYWTYDSKDYVYFSGPINKDGSRSIVYDHLKQMNSEINAYAYVFLSGKVVNVGHYGKFIPTGTQKVTTFPDFVKAVDIKCNTALISEIQNDSHRFLMIQNNDLTTPIEVNITVDADTKLVLKNGSIIPFSLINQPFKIESGDMVLFMK